MKLNRNVWHRLPSTGCLYCFDKQVRYDKNLCSVVLLLASFNCFCKWARSRSDQGRVLRASVQNGYSRSEALRGISRSGHLLFRDRKAFHRLRTLPLKKIGWKENDKRFSYATMIKGGEISRDWGVMVTRVPVALQKAQSVEERKAICQLIETKFVVISYDGDISFPEVGTSGRKKTKPVQPNL